METDRIILGDNLEIIKELPSESIDLVYADPPYNTNKDWHDSAGNFQFSDKWGGLENYLNFMRPVLAELHRVLAKTGSLYLHVDQTASHYLKVELDKVFGIENFRNQIIWCYSLPSVAKRNFARKHDVILFYSKGKNNTFNMVINLMCLRDADMRVLMRGAIKWKMQIPNRNSHLESDHFTPLLYNSLGSQICRSAEYATASSNKSNALLSIPKSP